jgi:hypothetical protein
VCIPGSMSQVACRYARPAAGEGMWPQAATQTEKGSCSSSKHGDVVPGQLQSATGDSDRPDLTCWGRATAAVVLMRERQPRIDQVGSGVVASTWRAIPVRKHCQGGQPCIVPV